MPSFFEVSRSVVRLTYRLLTRPRAIGRENIPAQGPVLIVCNHMSNVDPPLVGIFIDRKIMYMAKEELFSRKLLFFGAMLRNYGAFPIHKSRTDLDAMRKAKQVLEEGHPLMVFPEGKRSKDGKMGVPLPGPALIGARTGVPILPVGIIGTDKVSKDLWLLRRPVITVIYGKPFYLPPVEGRHTKEKLAALSECIMEKIAELLPPEYRGKYSGEGVQKTCPSAEPKAPSV